MIGEFAIVMSVRDGKAVVLAPGGQFLKIKDRNFHVGERIILEPSLLSLSDRLAFTFENTKEKCSRIIDRLKYKGLIILSSVVILVPSTAYATTKYVPWTYVSLDTGSVSVQYQLNARGEVLSAESNSDEGKKIINEAPPKRFEKVQDAMDRTLTAAKNTQTNETTPVLIGVSSRFGGENGTIRAIREHRAPGDPADFHFEQVNWSDTGKAREENLSIGQFSLRSKPENEPLIPTIIPENKPFETEKPLEPPVDAIPQGRSEPQDRPALPEQHKDINPPENPINEEGRPQEEHEMGIEGKEPSADQPIMEIGTAIPEGKPEDAGNQQPIPSEKPAPNGQNPQQQDQTPIVLPTSAGAFEPAPSENREPPSFDNGQGQHKPPSGEPPTGNPPSQPGVSPPPR